MGDVRDPERPPSGKIPVQEVVIGAIREWRECSRTLETHNGRDALNDAWEGAVNLLTYLTQMRLERGDRIEGAEHVTGMRGAHADFVILDEAVDHSLAGSPAGTSVNALDSAIPRICPLCRHEPHTPGHCRSQALNLGCGCLCE